MLLLNDFTWIGILSKYNLNFLSKLFKVKKTFTTNQNKINKKNSKNCAITNDIKFIILWLMLKNCYSGSAFTLSTTLIL